MSELGTAVVTGASSGARDRLRWPHEVGGQGAGRPKAQPGM